jgi:hypothetical protein
MTNDCLCPTCQMYRERPAPAPGPVLETLPCTCNGNGIKGLDPDCPRFCEEQRRRRAWAQDDRLKVEAQIMAAGDLVRKQAKDTEIETYGKAIPAAAPLTAEDVALIQAVADLEAPENATIMAEVRENMKEDRNTWTGGRKDDGGKAPLDLLSSTWLFGVAQVLGFGARKYDRNQWREGIHQSRLIAAALRHILAYNAGENIDPESGLCHLLHASCCLMFAFEMRETRPDLDDRYKRPASSPA